MHQALDSRLPGARWWQSAAGSGPVLSGSQWHWDANYDRHRELMNDNPAKVKTDGDAMNDEHFSAVRLDDAGSAALTVDDRLVDRLFPRAVAGATAVVSPLGTTTAPPPHTGAEPISAAPEPGPAGPRRLLLSTSDTGLHFALVTAGTGGSPEAARAELAAWAAATFTG
ncbi:hypothetical protein ACFFSW_35815 [Saccharothrix longispora]|uniref:Uncharacterized protein n=1 Tax=Saccharothrix longispora TaxID=33920 RepID=A0ABU1PPU1_9PSEU|nr:hypothetical protein [Saccharothrix longispora]MDR6591899.1 hypothetical protein [Saccharothrix longispora]